MLNPKLAKLAKNYGFNKNIINKWILKLIEIEITQYVSINKKKLENKLYQNYLSFLVIMLIIAKSSIFLQAQFLVDDSWR